MEEGSRVVLTYIDSIIAKRINDEIHHAKKKFPKDFNSTHEGFGVLMEEVDELWDEVKADAPKEVMREEAIQVAAMAIRFIQELTI